MKVMAQAASTRLFTSCGVAMMHRLPGRMSVWILCVLALAGCRGPVKINTEVKGQLDNPLKDTEALQQVSVDRLSQGCGKIALIDVDGVLLNMNMMGLGSAGDNPVESFREKLDLVSCDPGFRAVVLRINSPGGGVTATDIMWRDLQEFKARTSLPVVACLMDVGAGGAYYLATGADSIHAHPTTLSGGIGVILNRFNLQDLGEVAAIRYRPIKSGKYSDLGSPMGTLDEEGEKVLQSAAREFHIRFQRVVRARVPCESKMDAT